MTDRVRPVKQEDAATGGNGADDVEFLQSPANPNQDALDVRGVYFQNNGSNDTTAIISRDASDNLVFTDSVAGTFTLAQLAVIGSGSFNTGSVTVDFGFSTGEEETCMVVAVTGQTWVTPASIINAFPQGATSDHDFEDAALEGLVCTVGNLVNGVGFDIMVGTTNGTWGQYSISFNGA